MADDRHGFRLGQEVRWRGYRWVVDGFTQGGGIILKDADSPAIVTLVQAHQLNAPQ